MRKCHADKKKVDITVVITGKGELANSWDQYTTMRRCDGAKVGDVVAAGVPVFTDIRQSLKTRPSHCMPWEWHDTLLLPWVACVLNLDGVSCGANQRLHRRQREQCYHQVQCTCEVRRTTVSQNSFELVSGNKEKVAPPKICRLASEKCMYTSTCRSL